MLYVNPEERVTPEIVDVIKAHKKEIVQKLMSAGRIQKDTSRGSDVPQGSFWLIDGQVEPVPSEEIPLIQKLPYICLKNLPPTALLIYSRVLGERIWLVTSNELAERLQATGKAVYLLEEIARLIEQGLADPESIKAIHAVKQGFPGSYVQ